MKRKFEVVARKMKELQVATTWRDKKDQIEKPQCHFFIGAYDELVLQPTIRPDLDRVSNYTRDEGGQLFLQVPDGFDQVKIGKRFVAMGKEMQKGKSAGNNWAIAKDIRDFHRLLYGDAKFRTQGKNKQAKIRDTHTPKNRRRDNEIRTISSQNDDDEELEFVYKQPKIRRTHTRKKRRSNNAIRTISSTRKKRRSDNEIRTISSQNHDDDEFAFV